MKKIYSAMIELTNTVGEYQLGEKNEEEYGEQWNGDVRGYVENLDLCDGCEISDDVYKIPLHDCPTNSVLVLLDGHPHSIYWSEDVDISDLTDSDLAQMISDASDWSSANDAGLLRELCHRAGMDSEWSAADGEHFESVIYAASEKLGVEI